jgi:hypothetical protein
MRVVKRIPQSVLGGLSHSAAAGSNVRGDLTLKHRPQKTAMQAMLDRFWVWRQFIKGGLTGWVNFHWLLEDIL